MDCVGCEKCRLWGKIQILGIGTAIKVLLMTPPTPSPASSSSSCDHDVDAQDLQDEEDGRGLVLNRQEVIALLNTLNQLSKSIVFASRMMAQKNENDRVIEESFLPQEEEEDNSAGRPTVTDPIMELRTDASSSAMYLMKKRVNTTTANKLNIKAKAKKARQASRR